MYEFSDPHRNIQDDENGKLVNSISSFKVLVMGHKREYLAYVVEALHSYSFEVTYVDQFGAALRLLSQKTSKFDLLLVDCSINDEHINTFLGATKNVDVLSIVMSEQDDDEFIISALKSGASFVMKKPLTMEAMSHIRQYVIRERIRKRENHGNKIRNLKAESQVIGMQENVNLGSKRKDRGESSKQATSSNFKSNLVCHWSEYNGVRTMKKKTCVEWTPELHAKFINAVVQLGEGSITSPDNFRSRCYPKNILDLMAVPGLTRMQVASHLQKCRRENWKNDEERLMCPTSWNHKQSSDLTSKRATGNTFGRMPHIQINRHDQEESSKPIGFNLATNGWHQKDVNHMTNLTDRCSMMTRANQRNIVQLAGYTPISFQSGYGSKQDDGFGTKTTHEYYIQPGAGQHVDHHTFLPDEIHASVGVPYFLRDLNANARNDNLIAESIYQDHSYGKADEEMSDKYM